MAVVGGIERHVWAWGVGGFFAYTALIISLIHIGMHLRYNYSGVAKYEIRILLMVPIYCLCGWLGLYQKEYTEYWDLIRETFEAVVVYSFYRFLVVYVGGEERLSEILKSKHEKKEKAIVFYQTQTVKVEVNVVGGRQEEKAAPDQEKVHETQEKVQDKDTQVTITTEVTTQQVVVTSTTEKEPEMDEKWLHFGGHLGVARFLLKEWHLVRQFQVYTKIGILQYVPVRILWAFLGFILHFYGLFQKGTWSPKVGFPYYIITVNISQVWAIYCLLVFYHTMYEEIKNIKPLGKFLSIKLMVFCVFWQQIVINLCVRLRFISSTDTYSLEEVADGVQDFLICIEMFILSISHIFIWPAKEFYDPYQERMRRGISRLGSVLNPADMVKDIAHMPKHFKKNKSDKEVSQAPESGVDLAAIPEPSRKSEGKQQGTSDDVATHVTEEIPVDNNLDVEPDPKDLS